ncbi:hypothetical protein [Kangiella shandongensis]|uniref:hypothetical protein n=1 Tax=Kangiella shandongensis TaxID=2763258 RepID=UPI001CBC95F4|nr:hypothetical protein [Kangiella shandongensis]
MLKKLIVLITMLCLSNVVFAMDSGEESKQVENNAYQSYLSKTQSLINQKFPGFFSELGNSEQLSWIDYVGKQAAKYGYENTNLRQGFTLISCYLGKDFMADDNVDKDIKRFLKDERFSKYVRVRDMQRYLKRKKYDLVSPSVQGIK